MKRLFPALLGSAMLLGVVAPAHADPFKPSRSQQLELGERAAADIRKKEKVLPVGDERVQLLRRVGQRLLSTLTEPKDKEWHYSFDVLQNKELNAFALPGGPTFVFTGLLDKLKTEDELAGVMAHELTHVRREHWAYGYRDAQKTNLLLSLGLIVGKANQNVANVASIGTDVIIGLPNSRFHEAEADKYGFEMMMKAGYNPQGMSDVFTLLDQQTKGGKPPEFLSDHPSDKNRVKRIDDMIAKTGRTFQPQKSLPWVR